jgi:hypothetical protein
VSCGGVGFSRGLELVRFFDRNREMMLDMEKLCSEDLEGTKTAMFIQAFCRWVVMVTRSSSTVRM